MDTVRDRLERLKNTPSSGYYKPEQPRESKLLTPESIHMKKVEKALATVEAIRSKMHTGTDQYISLYQELKFAEDEFVKLLDDPETKFMDFPTAFTSRMDNAKKKLLTKKL
jgi:hypothetical protein